VPHTTRKAESIIAGIPCVSRGSVSEKLWFFRSRHAPRDVSLAMKEFPPRTAIAAVAGGSCRKARSQRGVTATAALYCKWNGL
jgi:hypothetical protein